MGPASRFQPSLLALRDVLLVLGSVTPLSAPAFVLPPQGISQQRLPTSSPPGASCASPQTAYAASAGCTAVIEGSKGHIAVTISLDATAGLPRRRRSRAFADCGLTSLALSGNVDVGSALDKSRLGRGKRLALRAAGSQGGEQDFPSEEDRRLDQNSGSGTREKRSKKSKGWDGGGVREHGRTAESGSSDVTVPSLDKVKIEFSRKIDCSELSRKPRFYSVEATPKECASLAKRFDVEEISDLKADLRVTRGSGRESRRISIKGRAVGDICQVCASSLEPFTRRIQEEFTTIVQEVSLDSVESTLWALDNDTETDDEIMEGDPLDLGEVAAQAIALCIDPFARNPDRRGQTGRVFSISALDAFAGGEEGPDGDAVADVETMNAFFESDD